MSEKKILVIDDDKLMRMMISECLIRNKYYAFCVDSGEAGIEAAIARNPHVIILDMIMPGIDGIETLKRLKAHPHTANIPVMMLTGISKSEDIATILKLGAKDYIVKPFEEENMLKRIKRVLGQ